MVWKATRRCDKTSKADSLIHQFHRKWHSSHKLRWWTTRASPISTNKLFNLFDISPSSLRQAYCPLIAVEVTYMKDTAEPTKHFLFWSRQDIIIAGYSAAHTNKLFLPFCTHWDLSAPTLLQCNPFPHPEFGRHSSWLWRLVQQWFGSPSLFVQVQQ